MSINRIDTVVYPIPEISGAKNKRQKIIFLSLTGTTWHRRKGTPSSTEPRKPRRRERERGKCYTVPPSS